MTETKTDVAEIIDFINSDVHALTPDAKNPGTVIFPVDHPGNPTPEQIVAAEPEYRKSVLKSFARKQLRQSIAGLKHPIDQTLPFVLINKETTETDLNFKFLFAYENIEYHLHYDGVGHLNDAWSRYDLLRANVSALREAYETIAERIFNGAITEELQVDIQAIADLSARPFYHRPVTPSAAYRCSSRHIGTMTEPTPALFGRTRGPLPVPKSTCFSAISVNLNDSINSGSFLIHISVSGNGFAEIPVTKGIMGGKSYCYLPLTNPLIGESLAVTIHNQNILPAELNADFFLYVGHPGKHPSAKANGFSVNAFGNPRR